MLSFFLLTGLVPLGAPPATAVPRGDFSVPLQCGSSAEFFETLEREHQIAPSELTFEQVQLSPDGPSFRLDWVDSAGTRTFRDPDCRTLFRTAIVIAVSTVHEPSVPTKEAPEVPGPEPLAAEPVSLAAAPPLVAEGAEPPAPGAPPEKAEPLAPETPVPAGQRTQTIPPSAPRDQKPGGVRPVHIRGEAALALGGAVALFPAPAFFAELSGGLGFGNFGTSLAFRYLPPTEANTLDSFGIRLQGIGGRLGFFYEPIDWLRADLGLGVTSLIGSATGVRSPSEDGAWLFAPELDLAGRVFQRRPFALDLGLRGWVAATTPRFEVDGEGEIYRVPPAGAAIFLRGRLSPR